MNEFNKVYEQLVEGEYFTEKELQLVICINGRNIESLNSAIYARYAYHDYEQLIEYEG